MRKREKKLTIHQKKSKSMMRKVEKPPV